jgi:hypothetical protein
LNLNKEKFKMTNIGANQAHFMVGFNHCVKCGFTKSQALVMAKGFAMRGMIDASEGCVHYALILTVESANKGEVK